MHFSAAIVCVKEMRGRNVQLFEWRAWKTHTAYYTLHSNMSNVHDAPNDTHISQVNFGWNSHKCEFKWNLRKANEHEHGFYLLERIHCDPANCELSPIKIKIKIKIFIISSENELIRLAEKYVSIAFNLFHWTSSEWVTQGTHILCAAPFLKFHTISARL